MEGVKTIIRRLGQAGIPVMGYNFSIAGVCGRTHAPYARGGAESVGMEGPLDTPMPNGMVWNMVYDPDAPKGSVPPITHEELWAGLANFCAKLFLWRRKPASDWRLIPMILHCHDARAAPAGVSAAALSTVA